MKHTLLTSHKLTKLMRRLDIDRPRAIGTLSLLWAFTQQSARRGDIGRHPDEDIALACDWERDPSELIEGLLYAGFLDRDSVHRLVIHDWSVHAPDFVKKTATRNKERLLTRGDGESPLTHAPAPPFEHTRPDDQSCPDTSGHDQTKPAYQTQPNATERDETQARNLGVRRSSSSPTDHDDDDDGLAGFAWSPGGGFRGFPARLRAELERGYPSLDFDAQLSQASSWLRSHPDKRPTSDIPHNLARFVRWWFGESERRRTQPVLQAAPDETPIEEREARARDGWTRALTDARPRDAPAESPPTPTQQRHRRPPGASR